MKAMLIDPKLSTVTEINLREGELSKAIGCSCCDMVFISKTEVVFVDDEGMLAEGNPVFYIKSYPGPLAGKAVVTGLDWEGECVDTKLSQQTLLAMIQWTKKESAGRLENGRTEGNTVFLGDPVLRDGGDGR